MTSELSDGQLEAVQCLPATSSEVSDELGISVDASYKRLNRAAEKGVIDKDGDVWVEPDQDGPDPDELSDREQHILYHLQTSASLEDLADELGIIPPVARTYINELENKGWDIYHDETAGLYEIEGDHTLRSSEHKGTRTRKAKKRLENQIPVGYPSD